MQTCGTYVKNKKSKNHQVLYVKMFGDFSLEYQGRSLIAKKKKETQFALVLQLIFHSGEEGISREKAFQEILKAVYEKGYEKSKNEKDFLLKESEIVKACREPSVIEIQEPAMIEKPGTLTRLNSLFDDGAVTDLVNGEQIRRNPDTIVIMTTNLDYVGCQNFNQSVLSRMNLIQPKEALTEEEMAKRAMKRTGFKNKELLSFMAATVCKIHEYLIEQDITDGVCGYRELENWVLSYMVSNDLRRSAWTALLSKASMDREEQGTMERVFLLPHCDVD